MPELIPIPIVNGELRYQAHFFSHARATTLFKRLEKEILWRQDDIMMFGKRIPQPRLVAWYGDVGIQYSYSGLEFSAMEWTDTLLDIKSSIEEESDTLYNSVLLNLYRDGKDSMSWHSDDEPELGRNPVIASVSLGGKRRFHLRHKSKQDQARIRFDLAHGSLLVMGGAMQHHWQHQISKTAKEVSPRINLTFRSILSTP